MCHIEQRNSQNYFYSKYILIVPPFFGGGGMKITKDAKVMLTFCRFWRWHHHWLTVTYMFWWKSQTHFYILRTECAWSYRSSRCCAGWLYPGPVLCSQTDSWWQSSWRSEQKAAPPFLPLRLKDTQRGWGRTPSLPSSLQWRHCSHSLSTTRRVRLHLLDRSGRHPSLRLALKQLSALQI